MNKVEFEQKLASYKSSSAPVEVKEKAINKLVLKFYGVDRTNEAASKNIQESAADISDMGGY